MMPKRSLITTLMIWYSLSTVALLLAMGVFLYPTFHQLLVKPAANTEALTIECLKQVILGLLLASVGALFIGHSVAKRNLRCIQDLEKTMASLSVSSLDQRLTLHMWPVELQSLGACFNLMLDRLAQSFHQLSQFSSDLAHELRHPLQYLKQLTEGELTKVDQPPTQVQLFEKYMDALDLLSKLLDQLLFIARAEQGQIPLTIDTVQIDAVVRQLFDFFHALAEEKSITLMCEGQATHPVDRLMLQRLLSNLLSNALRHTPSKGQVTVRIAHHADATLEIQVIDTGSGIEAQHLPRICDRFYRTDPARSHDEGMGLGLAIVQAIVHLHHGQLSIDSMPQTGTTITVTLPASGGLQ